MSSKKKTDKKSAKNNIPLLVAVLALCIVVGVAFAVQHKKADTAPDTASDSAAGDVSNTSADDAEEKSESKDVQVIAQGEKLVIPISEISSKAGFYTIEVDGTQMEVLAVTDSQGNIRTAFNTCQVCYGSGHGYYKQEGNVLVCQNCGNRFTVDQVEIESGGCNPWPIFETNKTVTDDAIEISYDFLKESEAIFSNWKTQY